MDKYSDKSSLLGTMRDGRMKIFFLTVFIFGLLIMITERLIR
jgi:hypothetical protein